MKTCTVFVASAVLAVISIDSAMGIASYLKQIPNGDSFSKELGHKGDSGYTDFGTAFSGAGAKWSADFCKQTFPGSTMTNGAAFGDPCCTWTAGGKPDFTVTAFTDKPTQETKCASAAAPSEAPAASSAAPTPAAPSDAPASTSTPAPAAGGDTPPAAPSTTPAPADKPSGKKPNLRPAKCGVKKDKKEHKKGKKDSKKESKSLDDDDDDNENDDDKDSDDDDN